MSRIFEALKLLQRERGASAQRPAPSTSALEPERRRGSRRFLHVPVFVYGRSPQGVPFHEETHMTEVNSGGGLTTLNNTVAPGQELLLVHLGTQSEGACRVVRVAPRAGQKAAIAIAFPESLPEFWNPK